MIVPLLHIYTRLMYIECAWSSIISFPLDEQLKAVLVHVVAPNKFPPVMVHS